MVMALAPAVNGGDRAAWSHRTFWIWPPFPRPMYTTVLEAGPTLSIPADQWSPRRLARPVQGKLVTSLLFSLKREYPDLRQQFFEPGWPGGLRSECPELVSPAPSPLQRARACLDRPAPTWRWVKLSAVGGATAALRVVPVNNPGAPTLIAAVSGCGASMGADWLCTATRAQGSARSVHGLARQFAPVGPPLADRPWPAKRKFAMHAGDVLHSRCPRSNLWL